VAGVLTGHKSIVTEFFIRVSVAYVKIRHALTLFNPLILFLLQAVPIDYDEIRFYAIFEERLLL
jgi:hypothetical protein